MAARLAAKTTQWCGSFSTRLADRAHAVVDAAGAEPALRDLEAFTLAEQDAGRRHPAVLKDDLRVALGRVGVAEHAHRPHDRDPRRVHRHEQHRLLLVHTLVRRVRLAGGGASDM